MNNRNLKLALLDAFASLITLICAFLLRFEFVIPEKFVFLIYYWVPVFSIIQIIVFYAFNLYGRIWRYTSLFDLYAILRAVAISGSLSLLSIFIWMGSSGYPRSVLLLYFILNTLIVIGIRLSVRVYFSHYDKSSEFKNPKTKKILLLIGAG